MQIMVLGLRGFPGVQGGVETHAERLYPRLRDLGCDIEVIIRSPYRDRVLSNPSPGIRLRSIWSPQAQGAEAFVHSLLGVLYAAWRRPDVLHIHAIGPALFAPLARLFGLRVVVTHHGPDYDREKWSPLAKWVLRTGERCGVMFADARIAISKVIGDLVRSKYGRECVCIPNGVDIPSGQPPGPVLDELGLTPGRYVLTVSRLVPEKRHLDLIEGFSKAGLEGWKLVLVGDASGSDAYTRRVVAAAKRSDDVVLAGYRSGAALAELYANAGVFVLASTHEGLPIALLEALSHGLPVLASDIPANQEVGLPEQRYFGVGDVAALAERLRRTAAESRPTDYRRQMQEWVRTNYDWDAIARNTLTVYKRVRQRNWRARLLRQRFSD